MAPQLTSPYGNGPDDLPDLSTPAPNASAADGLSDKLPKIQMSAPPQNSSPAGAPPVDPSRAPASSNLDSVITEASSPDQAPTQPAPPPGALPLDDVLNQATSPEHDESLQSFRGKRGKLDSMKSLDPAHQSILRSLSSIQDFKDNGKELTVTLKGTANGAVQDEPGILGAGVTDPYGHPVGDNTLAGDPESKDVVLTGEARERALDYIKTHDTKYWAIKAAAQVLSVLPPIAAEATLGKIGALVGSGPVRNFIKAIASAGAASAGQVGGVELAKQFEDKLGVPAQYQTQHNLGLEIAIPAGMSALGSATASQANKVGQFAAEGSALADQNAALQGAKPLESAANDAGVNLTPAQKLQGIPGSGALEATEADLGSQGGNQSLIYQNQVSQQRQQLVDHAVQLSDSLKSDNAGFDQKVAGHYFGDSANVSGYINEATEAKTGQAANLDQLPVTPDLPHQINEAFGQTLAYSRDQLKPVMRNKTFDPTQLMSGLEDIIRKRFSYNPTIVDPSTGQISISNLVKEATALKLPGASDFARTYANLKSYVNREASEKGLAATLGSTAKETFPSQELGQSFAGAQTQEGLPHPGSPAQFAVGADSSMLPPGNTDPQMTFDTVKTGDAVPPHSLGDTVSTPVTSQVQDALPGQSTKNSTSAELAFPNNPSDPTARASSQSASELASQLGGKSQPGPAQGGMTFDHAAAMTDFLQQMADYASNGDAKNPFNSALKGAAAEARTYEIGLIGQELKAAGQPRLADRILQFRDTYAKNIDAVNQFQAIADKEMPNLATQVIQNQKPSEADAIMGLMSPDQRREFRSQFLNETVQNMIFSEDGKPMKVDAAAAYKKLFGNGPDSVNKDLLGKVFGDDLPKVERFMQIASRVDKIPAGADSPAASKFNNALRSTIRGFQYMDLAGFANTLTALFPGRPEVSSYLRTSIDDLIIENEKKAASTAARQSMSELAQKLSPINTTPVRASIARGTEVKASDLYDELQGLINSNKKKSSNSSSQKDVSLEDVLGSP